MVRRLAAKREIHGERGRRALSDLADSPLHHYPHDFLLQPSWDLRNNLTACGAVYLALAETLDARLITRDRRLANAAGHPSRVELV